MDTIYRQRSVKPRDTSLFRDQKRHQKSIKSIIVSIVFQSYQYVIKPILRAFSGFYSESICPYTPSCSCYAKQSFIQHNILNACFLTLKRLLKCHPWTSINNCYDPVPESHSTKKELIS